jgi:hypothetical protein
MNNPQFILLTGGYNKGSQNRCYQYYNNGWKTNSTLKIKRHFAASVTISSNEAYILGGEENSSVLLDTAEKLNQAHLELIQMNMTFSRHCGIFVDDKTILIVGGVNEFESFSPKTFFYNLLINKFTSGLNLMKGRQLHSCSRINKKQFIVAGGQDSWGSLNSVEILDGINGEWHNGPSLPRKISSASMVEHPAGGVIVVGGQSGVNFTNIL